MGDNLEAARAILIIVLELYHNQVCLVKDELLPAPKRIDRETVYRLKRAGYSVRDIASKFEATPQAIYFILKKMPDAEAVMRVNDSDVTVVSTDIPATATAVRHGLENAGWSVVTSEDEPQPEPVQAEVINLVNPTVWQS